jgi:multidrug efflux pump subunit AcrA (membrane-fusion protein)
MRSFRAKNVLLLAGGMIVVQVASAFAAEAASPDAKIVTVQRACRNSVIRVTGFLVARDETGASLETPGYRVVEVLVGAGSSVEPGQELLRAASGGETSASQPPSAATPAQTSLRSPIKGVVTVVNAKVGDLTGQTASGSPQFRIAVNTDLDLHADVPSVYAVRFTKGLGATIPQEGRQPIHGAVRESVAVVDPASQLGHARISLEANSDLKAGQFVSADVRLDDICALTLPVSAVRFEGGKALVKVATASGPIDREVQATLRDGGRVEIFEGLKAGDPVMASHIEPIN